MLSYGYWSHNFASNQFGQPADVIACKDGKSILIDCKVCKSQKFMLSRIESNQYYSMKLFEKKGNGVGWFALLLDDEIYMLSLIALDEAKTEKQGVLNSDEIKRYGYKFITWIEKMKNGNFN